jgi:hypothetical protein
MSSLSTTQKILFYYGLSMVIALTLTYLWSWFDLRTLRDVGIWAKPMKFMAATAVFCITTVWLTTLVNTTVGFSDAFKGVAGLIIVTSFFEVAYISLQAARGEPSHYNTNDAFHIFMFALMGVMAVGLTASQAWLAWLIWSDLGDTKLSATTLGVLLGLGLTFVLATVSGFQLGGYQPPSGVGLPMVGWHWKNDLRPAHFLGVHAQQFIPLAGLLAERFLGANAVAGFSVFTGLNLAAWCVLTWLALVT